MPFDHFHWIAPLYARFSYDATRLKELAGLPRHGDLLDIGGGTGRVVKALRGLIGRQWIADISPGMLKQAKNGEGVIPVRALAERLPFADGHFELVLMVDSYHHLLDQQEALMEAWRVLRPGGKLIIEEPDIRHPLVKGIALAEKLLLMRSHFRHPQAIGQDLERIGAKISIHTERYNAWIVAEKPTTRSLLHG
ncbi:MAG: class I SAM-dependent methyltransferase [Anaerolineales bacterium]